MHPRSLAALAGFRVLFGFVVTASGAETSQVLRSCSDVRALTHSRAEEHLPVEITAVVTTSFPGKYRELTVQDETAGIYVDRAYSRDFHLIPTDVDWPVELNRGSIVHIRGVTAGGHFAPVICPIELKVLGPGRLPSPMPLSIAQALDGKWDAQTVSFTGVVQSAENRETSPERSRLEVASYGGRIPVSLFEPLEDPEKLINSKVEVTGVIFTYFNNRGEAVGCHLEVGSAADVRVLESGPSDPFAAPEIALTALRLFSPEGLAFQRRRCQGIVTLTSEGQFCYIQKDGRGIRVETKSTARVSPGDGIDASGFPEMGDSFGKLQLAVIRKIRGGVRPPPIAIHRKSILGTMPRGMLTDAEDSDGLFGRLTGKLERLDFAGPEGPRLFLESKGHVIIATLLSSEPPKEMDRLKSGAELQVDGVIRVELEAGLPAQSYPSPINYSLLVNSPRDIVVIRPAEWWTPARLWTLLGGSSAVLLFTLGWNWLLRQRVEQRSAELATALQARREAAVKFDATLRERERLAADLHDSLEQMLTSLALQLEAGAALREQAPSRSENHLRLAQQILARSREEVRRSVWNLRTNLLRDRTFSEAVRDIATLLATGPEPIIEVETQGDEQHLPDRLAGSLLLLAREALTNVVKHAHANRVNITVAYEDRRITLRVADDGRGFDPTVSPGPRDGHFGLLGMHERLRRLNGVIEISSAPGEGAVITATAPIDEEDGEAA